MADVKWIKITTDMFDNRKIKYLRTLPEGNNIVLIWVMLLTMAGRCNSGGMIFLTENIPYTTKILADELGFEENTVILALNALVQLGMIIEDRNFFSIAGWDKHQNTEGMDKIREQNKIRKQRQREKEKLLSATCHVTSRDSHATDKEEEKETDTDIEKENIKERSLSFDAEKAWDDTFALYPKKSSAVMAKNVWMDKLLGVIEPNRKDVAKLIYNATKMYLDDYDRNNPEDENHRYIPKYCDWLVKDCDYWISEVEKNQRGDGS